MNAPSSVLVHAQKLTKSYPTRSKLLLRRVGETVVVDTVDLAIDIGEFVGLVGESGSGKSTIGRMLLGFLPPTAGRIEFEGHDVTWSSARELRTLRPRRQMVFQDPYASLNPRLTAAATVREALDVNRLGSRTEREHRVRELFDLVRLAGTEFDRLPHELSGGQRQRVCIARALATSPRFLVADEALASLDVSIQAQIADLFLDLRSELGIACLFITHDLGMAGYLCDRVVVLRGGHIVETGNARNVLLSPQAEYTRGLVSAAPAVRIEGTDHPRAGDDPATRDTKPLGR